MDTRRELPQDFIQQMQKIIPEAWDDFQQALSESPQASIRYNNKIDGVLVCEHPVLWCDNANYLPVRPIFTLDPLFHAGTYYVQEASSMFLYQALLQYVKRESLVLDMCAAPGGKSTLISQFLNEDGFLVSNEYVSQRTHILAENMIKWGNANGVVTNNAPSHFEHYSQLFDVVVVDAPCSGEGMFRKDDRAITEWSLANVKKCVDRQKEILESAVTVLASDGILVYSTCTYNQQENEENVQWLLENYDMEFCPIELNEEWNVINTKYGYRFMPHKTKGEGLFIAVLRKLSSDGRIYREKKNKTTKLSSDTKLLTWLKKPEKFETILYKDVIYAVKKERYNFVLDVIERLNVFTFGVPLAFVKAKNMIPHVALALSKELNIDKFLTYDVDKETALLYLRTEALVLPNTELGYVLITYKNIPIGWIKNIGNRSNNMYPQNWRIRMSLS